MAAPHGQRTRIEIEHLVDDSAAKFGRWNNVLVAIGHGPPNVENVATYRRLMEQLLREHPDGIGVLTIIGDNTTPQLAARDALVSTFTSFRDRLSASFVVDSGGFAVAAQRAIITAILLASGLRKRINVSPSLGAGVGWLVQRLDDGAGGFPIEEFRLAVERYAGRRILEVTA